MTTQNVIGLAPIVRRRTASFPSRMECYFDCSQWGGGFLRIRNAGSGAVILRHSDGAMLDLQSGAVYLDSRFANQPAVKA